MNVRARILLSIGILTILAIVFLAGDLKSELNHNPEYTVRSSAIVTDYYVYFAENWNDQGWIYKIDDDGKVQAMTGSRSYKMDTIYQLGSASGSNGAFRLYALYSNEAKDKDGTYLRYGIVAFDDDLNPVLVSKWFSLEDNWTVCSLTADSSCVYITALFNDGEGVLVFSVPVSSMLGPDALDESDFSAKKNGTDGEVTREDYEKPDSVLYKERTAERFYVDASYQESELSVLLDGDSDLGPFAPNAFIKSIVDKIHFSPGQNFRLHAKLVIKIIGMFAIWLVLVILTLKLTKDRDRIVYIYLASEVVLFIILFVAFFFISQQFQKNEMKNNTRFAMMVMKEDLNYYSGVNYEDEQFFNSTKYYRLMDSLTEVINQYDEIEVFYDVFVMRTSTGMVLADARGRTGIHASYLYGGEMSDLIEKLQGNPSYVSESLYLDGEELTAVGYPGEDPQDDVSLVAVCKDRKSSEGYRSSILGLGILFLGVFAVGSVLLFISLYLQHVDLKRFSSALKNLALGKSKQDSPKVVSRDMRVLWQSYGELSQRIEQINYDKYMIFEAYYRFAPKGIETIMGKDSILDVRNGDVVSVSGTIVLISADKDADFDKKINGLSTVLMNMSTYARNNEGVLISPDPTLSAIRFLLLKEKGNTVADIVQFMQAKPLVAEKEISVLMYKDQLTYGVAGSPTQSLTYIDSLYSREMGVYSEWLRQLGVPLVATERIIRSEDAGESRYVGSAIFEETNEVVRFYEILDAYPAGTRQLMLINREKFEETLELFYSKDFYLARNHFMEILKDCPQDGVTRWYIFECERYMNGEADIKQSAYIQIER